MLFGWRFVIFVYLRRGKWREQLYD